MHHYDVNHLTCYTANVRSVNKKTADVQFFLDSNNPDIIVTLTETWLDKSTPSSLIVLSHLMLSGTIVCLVVVEFACLLKRFLV